MKCYNHATTDAVAVCKICQKCICIHCSAEHDNGMYCKHPCLQQALEIKRPTLNRAAPSGSPLWRQFLLAASLVLGSLIILGGIGFGVSEYRSRVAQYRSSVAQADTETKGKALAKEGAREIQTILSDAVASGELALPALFDENYVLIPGTDPPKYHTQYDSFLDKTIQQLEDRFLEDDQVVFAIAVDRNGYLPTHNSRFSQPLTGDPSKDRTGNRTKRIFNDPVGLAAARNQQEVLVQSYMRDTGEKMCDASAPVFIEGKHWGAFRVGLKVK